jgi:hypothetical protein
MDHSRAARGGQKPTAPRMRLIEDTAGSMLTTPLCLRSTRMRVEVLGGSLHLDSRPGTGMRVELRVLIDGRS